MMASNTADPPALAEPAADRHAPSARAARAVLAPFVVVSVVLAGHLVLPDGQPPPITWVASLPVWRHPYPVVLAAILACSLVLAAVQAIWHPARPWVRHRVPLLA